MFALDCMRVLLTVGCAEYNLPEDAFQLEADQHDASGHVMLRIVCVADNSTSWLVTCHKGRWTTDPEAPIDCAHSRHTPLHELASSVHVTSASAANQG